MRDLTTDFLGPVNILCMANIKVDKRQAINLLWKQGNLRWKLDKNQLEIYQFINSTNEKTIVIGSSRRIGKSYFLLTYAIQFCLKNPNSIVKFIAPTRQMVTSYVRPLFYEITVDCPKEILPTYKTKENIYKFYNGSEIQLAGTDNGNADRIRGGNAHLCILDEVGFIDDLDYVVNSVLLPTTTMTKGKIVMASTPPKSPDHPFIGFIKRAEESGSYIRKTIYDNPRLNKEEIEDIAASVGGFDTVDFKREYLAELVISEDDAVVPEFTDKLQQEIVKEVVRPPMADTYVAMDIGGSDLTAIIFGFYDFITATIVIQDELIFNRRVLTDEIATAVQNKEMELWGFKKPLLRVADNNNVILLNDLGIKHGLHFMPTLKDDKIAQLNNMRMMLKRKKIIIDPKCRTLISHLKGATWNKQRTSYTRSADKGHYDLCFTPGNRVLTVDGYKNIEDIQVGDEVLTHNNRFRKVLNTMNRHYSGILKSVKLSGQREIVCTPEHNFYAAETFKDRSGSFTGQTKTKELTWIPAESLKNHRVYSPSIEEGSYDVSNELCFLYGYYAAEGSCGGNGHQINFAGHVKETKVIEILEKAIKDKYGGGKTGTSKKSLYRHKNGLVKPRSRSVRFYKRPGKGRVIAATCSELREYLLTLNKGPDKRLPEFINKLNKEQALYMLAGYAFGDGHFSPQGFKSNSISSNITVGLEMLFRKLEIIPREKLYVNDNNNQAYELSISKQDTEKFLNLIHSRDDLAYIFQDKLIHEINIKYRRHYDLRMLRVKSVDDVDNYSGLVYNLEVEEDNSYVVNGAAVHNCDALTYLVRNVNLNKNPYPEAHNYNSSDYMVVKTPQPTTQFEQQLVSKIKRNNPFRRR